MRNCIRPLKLIDVRIPTHIADVLTDECTRDRPRVALPRAEVQLAIRFGPTVRNGLDIHALGPQQVVRRKTIRSGHRTVMARLELGAHERVLGVPASVLTGGIVPLEDLWGRGVTNALVDRLSETRSTHEAAVLVRDAIAAYVATTDTKRTPIRLALAAAARLGHQSVTDVASELGVSERHLRRVFRDATGLSPKTFAKMERFRRAVHAARVMRTTSSWAHIAAEAGYYDQAHLIGEFRAIAGVTPQTLLDELMAGAYHA